MLRIIFPIFLILFILNIVFIVPVMENSRKKEPIFEIGSSLVPKYEHKGSLAISEGDCEKNLYNSLKNGVFETFDLKMKKINSYSTGILIIFVLKIDTSFILLIFLFTPKDKIDKDCLFVPWAMLIIFIIAILLNFIFFILLSVSLNSSKIDEFKDFGKCFFFDEANFNKTFDFIFSVYKNGKRAFIVDLIYVILNFASIVLLIILYFYGKNKDL